MNAVIETASLRLTQSNHIVTERQLVTAVLASVSHITEDMYNIEVTSTIDHSDCFRLIILWKASLNERSGCFP